MKVLDLKLLKLGLSVGLAMGMAWVLLEAVLGLGWLLDSWKWLKEVLALFWGLVFSVSLSDELTKIKMFRVIVAKYGLYVLELVLVWLLWLILLWRMDMGDQVGEQVIAWLNSFGSGGGSNRVEWSYYVMVLFDSFRIVVWGLLVVFAFRLVNLKIKSKR